VFICTDNETCDLINKSKTTSSNLSPETTLQFHIFCWLLSLSLSLSLSFFCLNSETRPYCFFSSVLTVSGHQSFSLFANMVTANERVVAVIMVGGPTKGIPFHSISFIHTTIFIHSMPLHHFTIP